MRLMWRSAKGIYSPRATGAWNLFHDTFVLTGRFDRGLYAATHANLERGIEADYKPATILGRVLFLVAVAIG